MRDVAFLAKNKSSGDVRHPFKCSDPASGLIDLSEYGVRPVKKQDLDVLKEQVKSLILRGEEKVQTPPAVTTKGNVAIRRISQDKFQYLLKLDGTMERGQSVEVCFPEVSQLLRSRFYRGTDFQRRHLIGEALHLLSREDLESMISFLEKEVLQTIGYENILSTAAAGGDSYDDFRKSCKARRRLHWVSMRIGFALGGSERVDKLYFGPLTPGKNEAYKSYPDSLLQELGDAISSEVKNEMRCLLELDSVCGSQLQGSWCPFAQQSLNKFVDCILNYYTGPGVAKSDEMLEKLKLCLDGSLSEAFTADQITDYGIASSTPDTDIDRIGSKALQEVYGVIQRRDDDISLQAKHLVVCYKPEDDNLDQAQSKKDDPTLVVRPPGDIKDFSKEINEAWYRQLQWDIAMTVVAKAGSLLGSEERPHFMNERMLYELKQLAMKKTGVEKLDDPKVHNCLEPVHKPAPATESERAPEPHSRPFFLCLVWPTLRKLMWRLESGDSPDSVTFIAPDAKTFLASRANPWKQHRDQVRARLARETTRTGLGQVSKLTKRLIVSLLPQTLEAETNEEKEETPSDGKEDDEPKEKESKGLTAKMALRLFSNNLISGLSNDDKNGRVLVKKIVDAVLECFEEVAPMLTGISNSDDSIPDAATAETSSASKPAAADDEPHDGCDYLLRLLLVLPSILRQSDLPLQEINDSLEVIQELVAFITKEHEGLFNKAFHPPREQLARQNKPTRPALTLRLRAIRAASNEQDGADSNVAAGDGAAAATAAAPRPADTMTEIVREKDKLTLTDFVVTVLEQAVPCRATEKDLHKKFRRIHIGYPGFVCRHCGGAGEGRYFFTTIESLTTASTVFEKHVLKCSAVPPTIKSEVVAAKARHPEQRKGLPAGSQQAFFNSLWDRLRASKIDGVTSGVYTLESYSKAASDLTGEGSTGTEEAGRSGNSHAVEFKDHIELLDYVRKTAPWKSNNAMLEVLNQYYNCLDYGGRIVYTASAPDHFSSEWLLAKIAPRPRDPLKSKKCLPG